MSFGGNDMGKAKKKKILKTYLLSSSNAQNWYASANFFAYSQLSMHEAISEFNKLSPEDRLNIKKALESLDKQRMIVFQGLSKDEVDQYYYDAVFVDSHIVATDYNTDPVVVLMCIKPPCSLLNKVVVK